MSKTPPTAPDAHHLTDYGTVKAEAIKKTRRNCEPLSRVAVVAASKPHQPVEVVVPPIRDISARDENEADSHIPVNCLRCGEVISPYSDCLDDLCPRERPLISFVYARFWVIEGGRS